MPDEAIVRENGDRAHRDEADATAAITPGHLVEYQAGGGVAPHGTDAGPAAAKFAGLPMDPEKEKTDAYELGERVRIRECETGVELEAIASAAVSDGDYLVSDGAGQLRAVAAGEEGVAIAQAKEAAGAGGDRFRVEVL